MCDLFASRSHASDGLPVPGGGGVQSARKLPPVLPAHVPAAARGAAPDARVPRLHPAVRRDPADRRAAGPARRPRIQGASASASASCSTLQVLLLLYFYSYEYSYIIS